MEYLLSLKEFAFCKLHKTIAKFPLAKKATNLKLTRTKTSIRYAKENDREKRERWRERERKVEGEI